MVAVGVCEVCQVQSFFYESVCVEHSALLEAEMLAEAAAVLAAASVMSVG